MMTDEPFARRLDSSAPEAETADPPLPVSAREKRRRIAADLRDKVLKTAVELVASTNGLTVGLDELNMEEVIKRANVSRSAVYRLWPYKGDFVEDVLVALASSEHISNQTPDEDAMQGAGQRLLQSKASLGNAGARRDLTRELIREYAHDVFLGTARERVWHESIALLAGTRFVRSDDVRVRLAAELERTERGFVDHVSAFYELMLPALGLRLRPGLTIRHLATSLAAAIEGLGLRKIIIDGTQNASVPSADPDVDWALADVVDAPIDLGETRPDGTSRPWSLAALTFLAIVDAFTEEIPDWQVPDWITEAEPPA